MSNSIALNRIDLDGQKVTYNFSIPSEIREHINPVYVDSQSNGTLFIELPNGVVAKEIPEGIPPHGVGLGSGAVYSGDPRRGTSPAGEVLLFFLPLHAEMGDPHPVPPVPGSAGARPGNRRQCPSQSPHGAGTGTGLRVAGSDPGGRKS